MATRFHEDGGVRKRFSKSVTITDEGIEVGGTALSWSQIRTISRDIKVQHQIRVVSTRVTLRVVGVDGTKLKIQATVTGRPKQAALFDTMADILDVIEPRVVEAQWPRVRQEIQAGTFAVGKATFTPHGLVVKKRTVPWAAVEGAGHDGDQLVFLTTDMQVISRQPAAVQGGPLANRYIQRHLAEIGPAASTRAGAVASPDPGGATQPSPLQSVTTTAASDDRDPQLAIAEQLRAGSSAPIPTSSVGRAALGVTLIAGFFVLGIVAIVASGALALFLIDNANRAPAFLIILPFVITFGVITGFVQLLRKTELADDGLPIDLHDHPKLAAQIADIAARMGAAMPDDVRILPEVNAFVAQESRLLGLITGKRQLAIGAPLLATLTVSQMRAVLAHEYGHYVGGDTRLSGLIYSGQQAMLRGVQANSSNLFGRVLEAYTRFYIRTTLGVSRAQEVQADAAAARVGGKDAMASALVAVEIQALLFNRFLRSTVEPLWREGMHPPDLFDGFQTMSEAHADRREDLEQALVARQTDPYDTHPPLQVRLAAIDLLEPGDAPQDDRLARELLTDPSLVMQKLAADLGRQVIGATPRLVSWNALLDLHVRQVRSDAAAIVATLGPEPVSLQRIIDSAAVREPKADWWTVARAMDPRMGTIQFRDQVALADQMAVVGPASAAAVIATDQLGATWTWTMAEGARVQMSDGTHVRFEEMFSDWVGGGDTAGLLSTLHARGVSPDLVVPATAGT